MNALNTTTIEQDGFIIDIETGEIIGLARPEFHVIDADSADWVLEKILDAKANIAREDMKLKSIAENIESRKADQQRRIAYLEWKFGPELEQFAKEAVANQKTKTWKGVFGQLKFRTVKGGVRVSDPELAFETAKSQQWVEAIKTVESFQISKLPDALKSEAASLPGFEVKPDSEVFDIKVGGS